MTDAPPNNVATSKAEELRTRVQNEIVKIISTKLEEGTINQDRAKAIAQMVLQQLPQGISYEKLMQVIPTLDDHFSELSAAVIPIMVEYEQKMKLIVSERITALIKQGKFSEAENIAKKAIEFEKNLS